eukprot:jgi/Psemu1/8572/gm1.8572_g
MLDEICMGAGSTDVGSGNLSDADGIHRATMSLVGIKPHKDCTPCSIDQGRPNLSQPVLGTNLTQTSLLDPHGSDFSQPTIEALLQLVGADSDDSKPHTSTPSILPAPNLVPPPESPLDSKGSDTDDSLPPLRFPPKPPAQIQVQPLKVPVSGTTLQSPTSAPNLVAPNPAIRQSYSTSMIHSITCLLRKCYDTEKAEMKQVLKNIAIGDWPFLGYKSTWNKEGTLKYVSCGLRKRLWHKDHCFDIYKNFGMTMTANGPFVPPSRHLSHHTVTSQSATGFHSVLNRQIVDDVFLPPMDRSAIESYMAVPAVQDEDVFLLNNSGKEDNNNGDDDDVNKNKKRQQFYQQQRLGCNTNPSTGIFFSDPRPSDTVKQNYYLHNLGSGRSDQRLITRSGDCFDLTRASDKSREAARDKLFLSGFPQLKNSTAPQVRKWYREVTARALQHHIYVHPYYLHRREADHLRGFTIGDTYPDDLPARYELAIHEWGNLIYTALRTDKTIPDSCKGMKAAIQSFEGGQGYEALLYSVIAKTHPNSERPSYKGRMARNPPNQEPDKSLEEYYFRYKDYLRLKVFLHNQSSTISLMEEVSNLIEGATLSYELCKMTEDEWESDDQFKRDKYKAGRLLQTLQTYEQEIKVEMKYKDRVSRSSYKLTQTTISYLIETLGCPEMDEESDDQFLYHAYCNAINAFDKEPRLFDTSRKCIVCHNSGHTFDSCPALQDVESLRKHRIATAVFLSKCNRELLDSTQRIAKITTEDKCQDAEPSADEPEDQNFCYGQE